MKRSVTGIKVMKQITVVQQHMTAAMLRKSSTKLEALLHCLKVKQQTGWRQMRRGCPNKQGSLGKKSQVRVELQCQEPGAIQASMARQQAPRPAVLVGCEQHNRGFRRGSTFTPLVLKIPLQLLCVSSTK